MINEDRSIRLLLPLKKVRFITKDEWNMAKPVSSRLTDLYGLRKHHKPNHSLGPAISVTETVGYDLDNMLTNHYLNFETVSLP
jgi:hypothetical protein